MKKLLSIAIVAAFLGAAVGCDDKKTSPPKTNTTGTAPGGAGTTTKT